MKRLYPLLLTLIFFKGYGQQAPQFSQYATNNFLLNPAVTGSYDYGEVKVGVRAQWTGFEGAPQTLFVTGHTPLRKTNHRVRKKNKQSHGVGMMIYTDRIGPFSNSGAYAAYAFHLPVGNKTVLSMGASFGLRQLVLHGEQLKFVQFDDDPMVEEYKYSKILPDGNVGLWLNSKKYFAGIGVTQLFRNSLSEGRRAIMDKSIATLKLHYYGTMGYIYKVDKYRSIVPSIMIKAVDNAPISVDFNLIFNERFFWVGGGYRHQDSFVFLAGINIKNYSIGYSYDLTTSRIRKGSMGSHEIVLGYKLIRNKIDCPSNYW